MTHLKLHLHYDNDHNFNHRVDEHLYVAAQGCRHNSFMGTLADPQVRFTRISLKDSLVNKVLANVRSRERVIVCNFTLHSHE